MSKGIMSILVKQLFECFGLDLSQGMLFCTKSLIPSSKFQV
jgi:hypothetical protein